MFAYHPISLADKPAVDAIFRQHGQQRASHSFPALYMWRDYLRLSIALGDDWYIVRAGEDGMYFPCGSMVAKYKCIWHALDIGVSLRYLTDSDKAFLEAAFPERFDITEDVADTEYIFSVPEQADLSLPGFAAVRGRMDSLLAAGNRWEAEAIGPSNIHLLPAIVADWNRRRAGNPLFSFGDATPTLDMLDAYALLELCGILLKRDGKAVAFCLGTALGDDLFGLHSARFQGEDTRVMEYCLQQLCRALAPDFARINGEEDMGIPTLRTLLHGHRPAEQIRMWRAKPTQE